ncbi:MAG: hypothetical protein ACE37J_19440 [Pikeienuella sp.]|uniref:hypothetical protein n=1 Tax=Pikeienuella sp. TaxID=2831957 RepID=UPI00391D55F0
MSLAAEIAFAQVAAALGGPAILLSAEGVGSPLAAASAAPLARAALRPACGLRRAPSLWLPPILWTGAAPPGAWLLVDARSGEAALRAAPADALRGFGAPGGMAPAYLDPETGEGIWFSPRAAKACAGLPPPEADEYDALRAFVGKGLAGLRHSPLRAEALLDPLLALDSLDERQRDEALGAGRPVFAEDGVARLAIPALGSGRTFGVTVSGLPPGAPDPLVLTPGLPATAERAGPLWRLRAAPRERGEAARLALSAPGLPGAEISELWTEAQRARRAGEIWEEAERIAAADSE